MGYSVKEIFYSLQGEGAHAGRPAIFLRFTGCNLWSGREVDRQAAACRFCDTDFVGTDGGNGGRFATADDLADAVDRIAGTRNRHRCAFVVVTGGEPALQLDRSLIEALHRRGFRIAIETNGTLPLPSGLDWICVSPKAGTTLVVPGGDELKLVFQQRGGDPERFAGLAFRHFFLQPMDGPARDHHTRLATAYCLAHPRWRLSLQLHKVLGIP